MTPSPPLASIPATGLVTITVHGARPVASRSVFALVDVDIDIDGVLVSLFGVQARRLPTGGTEIVLPRSRTHDGVWTAAVGLPDPVSQSLARAVLCHLVDERLAHDRLVRPHGSAAAIGWP